ncbi:putative middle T antigen, partial [Trichinella spiralis]|uniref:putative middle T antigen n=1 Tax=Trichinella spiralis TaxID=6334 RepID=UPI0001EFC289
ISCFPIALLPLFATFFDKICPIHPLRCTIIKLSTSSYATYPLQPVPAAPIAQNLIPHFRICASVAKPGIPTNNRRVIWKIFSLSFMIVKNRLPSRKSHPIVTQSPPRIASTMPPLWSMILI